MLSTELPLLPLVLDDVPTGLRLALAQEGVPCVLRRADPTAGQFVLFDSRRNPAIQRAAGQQAIDVDHLRRGWAVDPFVALVDEVTAVCRWTVDRIEVSEETARYDKRAIRRRVLESLRALIEASGGVWFRVSPYPFPYRSAFNFRIDYDEYDPNDFATTLSATKGYEEAFSHFVCASAYESVPQAIGRLAGSDVGSHGYYHHTYRTTEENLRNVCRGIECLQSVGIEPSGFVAPHGRFNRSLLDALVQLNVSHSSEFALSYDELPFFVDGGDVLQMPVHPVCLGLFLAAGVGKTTPAYSPTSLTETVARYFERLALARYRAGEPIFLYGHPTRRLGRHPSVITRVVETVARYSGIWKTNLTEFGRWWRARANLGVRLLAEGNVLTADVTGGVEGYRYGGELWRGKQVALVPLDEPLVRFSLTSLAFENRNFQVLPQPVRIDRPHDLRTRLRRYLDWERVTPIEEITDPSFRGVMKRTLRRFRE